MLVVMILKLPFILTQSRPNPADIDYLKNYRVRIGAWQERDSTKRGNGLPVALLTTMIVHETMDQQVQNHNLVMNSTTVFSEYNISILFRY